MTGPLAVIKIFSREKSDFSLWLLHFSQKGVTNTKLNAILFFEQSELSKSGKNDFAVIVSKNNVNIRRPCFGWTSAKYSDFCGSFVSWFVYFDSEGHAVNSWLGTSLLWWRLFAIHAINLSTSFGLIDRFANFFISIMERKVLTFWRREFESLSRLFLDTSLWCEEMSWLKRP